MNKIFIGKNTGDYIISYENALIYYVYGRVTWKTEGFIFLLPAIFYFFHHALEVSIKTLLKLKNIKYPDRGQDGHKICELLKLVTDSNLFSQGVRDLITDEKLIELLIAMDNSYLDNKYEYPGYNLVGVKFVDLVDKIIIEIFNEINSILKLKNHAPASLNVPECVEKVFIHELKNLPNYYVWDFQGY